jgi:hypothetical protein
MEAAFSYREHACASVEDKTGRDPGASARAMAGAGHPTRAIRGLKNDRPVGRAGKHISSRHLCLHVSLARRPGRGMLSFEFTYREKRHGGCS